MCPPLQARYMWQKSEHDMYILTASRRKDHSYKPRPFLISPYPPTVLCFQKRLRVLSYLVRMSVREDYFHFLLLLQTQVSLTPMHHLLSYPPRQEVRLLTAPHRTRLPSHHSCGGTEQRLSDMLVYRWSFREEFPISKERATEIKECTVVWGCECRGEFILLAVGSRRTQMRCVCKV